MLAFVKKYWFLFALFVLASAVVFAWISSRQKAVEPPLKEGVEVEKPRSEFSIPSEGNVQLDITQEPVSPISAEVFAAEEFNEKTLQSNLARLLSFAGVSSSPGVVSEEPRVLLFQEGPSALAATLPSGKFLFEGKGEIDVSVGVREAVTRLVKELRLVEDVSFVELEGLVAAGDELREPRGRERPTAYVATVFPKIGQLSVLGAGAGQQPLVVKLFADGIVFGIERNYHLPGKSLGSLPLIPYSEAAALAVSGGGEYLWIQDLQGRDTVSLDRERLEKTVLTSVSLFYFESGETQSFVQPVYVFQGEAETAGGAPRRVALMVPAVEGAVLR